MHDQAWYHIYKEALNGERYLAILQAFVTDFGDNFCPIVDPRAQ